MGDIFLIVFLIAIPIGFVLYSKGMTRVLWLGCLAGMVSVLGGCEAYCKFVDPAHLTLSQRFAAMDPANQIVIALLLFIGWGGLLLHLLWPLIKKNFAKKEV